MDVLVALIVWAVFGLIAGAGARLLVPGRQPIGILWTIALGMIGALAVTALDRGESGYLDAALVLALLGFAQTTAAARFCRRPEPTP